MTFFKIKILATHLNQVFGTTQWLNKCWQSDTVEIYKASVSIRIWSNVQLCQQFPFVYARLVVVPSSEVFGQCAIPVRCLGNLCKICKWEQINAGMCHRLVSWHLTWQLTTLWQHCAICNILIKLGLTCDDDDDDEYRDICWWFLRHKFLERDMWWWWQIWRSTSNGDDNEVCEGHVGFADDYSDAALQVMAMTALTRLLLPSPLPQEF